MRLSYNQQFIFDFKMLISWGYCKWKSLGQPWVFIWAIVQCLTLQNVINGIWGALRGLILLIKMTVIVFVLRTVKGTRVHPNVNPNSTENILFNYYYVLMPNFVLYWLTYFWQMEQSVWGHPGVRCDWTAMANSYIAQRSSWGHLIST